MLGSPIVLLMGIMLVQCLPKHEYTATFDLHITEKGTLFDQNVQTDIINDVVYYHTPAHNDLNEMYKMQDFKQGLQISCYPSKSECFLEDLDRTLYPNAAHVTESLLHGFQLSSNTISDKNPITTKSKKWYNTGNAVDVDDLVSQSAQTFVADFGFTLYEAKLVPDNAHFLYSNTTIKQRKRRNLTPANDLVCLNNQSPIPTHAYTYAGCDNLHVCDGLTCETTHIRNGNYWLCLCCPEHTNKSQCRNCHSLR